MKCKNVSIIYMNETNMPDFLLLMPIFRKKSYLNTIYFILNLVICSNNYVLRNT